MNNRRFYWFKLSKDFFDDRRIQRLRKLAGGDTFTIIYMKMILLTLSTKGLYEICEYEDVFESLSLDIGEDIDNIKVTVEFLKSCGLVEENDERDLKLTDVERLTQSECSSAERVRNYRNRKKIQQDENNNLIEDKRKNELTKEEYDTLVTMFGNEIVDDKINRSKMYKNCTNFEVIKKWCNDEIRKELSSINVI